MGTKNIQNIIRLFVLCICFSACVKDKPAEPAAVTPQPSTPQPVYVVCEGNFGNGDGGLYQYDPSSSTVSSEVYASANNGSKLGDVFQSMVRIKDWLFLCINNSDKIVVLNRDDKKQVGTISIPKPRYILPVSDTKAYVSTLFSNKVYVINPRSLQITGTLQMPYQNPEGMALYNGNAYICTWDTACRELYEVDITTDAITRSIALPNAAPQEAMVDKDNHLWVLSGNMSKGKAAALTVLDDKGHIIRSYDFPAKADVVRPVMNTAKDMLYFIEVNYTGGTDNNGVYRMGINAAALPTAAFVNAQTFQYFWALGIDPKTDRVYIGDPKGFVQKGSVLVYDTNGNQAATFNVGVGPGHFLFD